MLSHRRLATPPSKSHDDNQSDTSDHSDELMANHTATTRKSSTARSRKSSMVVDHDDPVVSCADGIPAKYRTRRRLGQWLLIMVVSLCIYWKTVERWGTISPLVVWARTADFQPQVLPVFDTDAFQDLPPAGWRAPFRVVVTLTTLPHHAEHLPGVVDTILAQSYVPDRLYLNVPDGQSKTGEAYDSPKTLAILKQLAEHDIVTVNRGKDWGPATKLIPAVDAESDPDTLLITVDDDFWYSRRLVERLAWQAYRFPEAAWGECGWGFLWTSSDAVVPVYVPFAMRGSFGRKVEVLQACCGNAYRREWFGDAQLLKQIPKDCFTTDDIWIAGFLAVHKGIDRVLLPYREEPQTPDWKAADQMANAEFALSSHNDLFGDARCVEAVQKVHGKPWPKIR